MFLSFGCFKAFYVSFSFSNCHTFYVHWMNQNKNTMASILFNGFDGHDKSEFTQTHGPCTIGKRVLHSFKKQAMRHNILSDLYCLNNQCKLYIVIGCTCWDCVQFSIAAGLHISSMSMFHPFGTLVIFCACVNWPFAIKRFLIQWVTCAIVGFELIGL